MQGLAALLFILSTGTSAYAQAIKLEILNDKNMSLYRQDHNNRAVVVAKISLQVPRIQAIKWVKEGVAPMFSPSERDKSEWPKRLFRTTGYLM